MYFAVNSWCDDLPEQMLAVIRQLREQRQDQPLRCYVLIDGAFDESFLSSLPWRRSVACSLYAGTRLEGLKLAAPHLLSLEEKPEKQLAWLKSLVEACAGKPMLSIVASALSANRLSAHFKPYLLARTEDSIEWPVRWADTRVLPSLLAAMTSAVHQHFLSPIDAWFSCNRQGQLVQCSGAGNPAPEPAGFDCWPLDESCFSRLLGDAEADALISQIDDRRPNLLADGKPADIHARVARQLEIATHYHLSVASERLHFAMLGLIYSPEFVDALPMQLLLNEVAKGSDYQAQVRQLPADFWVPYVQGKTS